MNNMSAGQIRKAINCCALLFCGFVLLGCTGGDKDLGLVEGLVSIDGQPADKATIRFYPSNGSRGSFGVTDGEGRYELVYTVGKDGAKIGQHKVTISTKLTPDYSMETRKQIAPGRKESLPKKYYDRRQTELTANVASGSNEIDFDLSTSK